MEQENTKTTTTIKVFKKPVLKKDGTTWEKPLAYIDGVYYPCVISSKFRDYMSDHDYTLPVTLECLPKKHYFFVDDKEYTNKVGEKVIPKKVVIMNASKVTMPDNLPF